MTPLLRIVSALLAICSNLAFCVIVFAESSDNWTPLFNGKDLTGWHIVLSGHKFDEDPDRLVQVDDGNLHFYKDATEPIEQPCGFLCSESKYDHYRLRFEYRWGKKRFVNRDKSLRDSGFLYHLPDMKSVHGVWPTCIECQVQEGDTGDLICVNTACTSYVDPATQKAEYPTFRETSQGGIEHENKWYINANKTCDRLTDWNTVEVVVCGDAATQIVNGQVNQRLKNIRRPEGKEWVPLSAGHVAFQLEDAEVFYRNIEIQPLPKDANIAELVASEPRKANSGEGDTAGPPSKTEAASRLQSIKVPDGFTVELAAESPLVQHPMMACLDDRGRMFVAESDGGNREAQQLLDEKPHKIVLLEDNDGDGVYDTRTVFADNLVLPNGAQWYDGALYVCSPPFIWRFRDLDGDGRAEERTPIAGTFNFDGMSSALHGPVLGPDGRLYWSGGQHGWILESPAVGEKRKRADPKKLGYDSGIDGPWTRFAPGAFSCWPDGSDAECLANGGICNPVETAFTPEGEVLGTVSVFDYVDNQRRDAVVHWVDGGIFNMSEKNYAGLIRTGKDLIPVSYRGHAAPSGILRYRGEQFGREYQDNFFFAEFNTHKVYRLVVERNGASFRSQDQVFASSSHPDTHFTDVMEDADGSLLVIDTGGWFRYGCPTSQIAKPNIEGKVYRIRKSGPPSPADARGAKLAWDHATNDDFVARLSDQRFAVRDRTKLELTKKGETAIPALRKGLASESSLTRLLCVQALTGIHTDTARSTARLALDDADFSVRLAAAHDACLHRDQQAAKKLISMLADDEPAVRREAATALGRIRSKEAVPGLLATADCGDDHFLTHAATLALIRIGDGEATVIGLSSPAPSVRRAALVVLDQMQSLLLTRDELAKLLDSNDDGLADAALDVLHRRPSWADEIAGRLGEWLDEAAPTADRDPAIRGVVSSCWTNENVQKVVAQCLSNSSTTPRTQLLVLEAIGVIDSDQLPEIWKIGIEKCLDSSDPVVVRQAVATIGSRHQASFASSLSKVARTSALPIPVRLAATLAVVQQAKDVPDDLFSLLADQCVASEVAVDRLAAAQALGSAPLSDEQRQRVLKLVASAGPLELPSLLNAFERGSIASEGLQLVDALRHSPGLSSLSGDRLTKLLSKYPAAAQEAAAPILVQLSTDSAGQAEKLQHLVDTLDGGNPAKGHEVFLSERAACSTCHRVRTEGGTIGPNLSRIAEIRSRRDLIEAVVFPSASFARGFEPYVVITNEGKVHTGIISRETAQAIYFRTPDRSEIRVGRDEIEELNAGAASIMPKGLDQVLTESQLRDLIAFLSTLKQ